MTNAAHSPIPSHFSDEDGDIYIKHILTIDTGEGRAESIRQALVTMYEEMSDDGKRLLHHLIKQRLNEDGES